MHSSSVLDLAEGQALSARTALAILLGIGGLLTGTLLFDLLYEWRSLNYSLWLVLAENGLPLLLASTIPVLAWHLSRRRHRRLYLSETAKWCVLGFFFTIGISIVAVLVQRVKGQMNPMVYLITTLGPFAGALIGYHTARLKQTQNDFRSIAENISDGIYRSTPEEGLVYANRAFAEMFGYESPEAILQVNPEELYATPEERARLEERAEKQDRLDGVEVEFRRKDGTRFTGLLTDTVVRDEDGEAEYYDGAVVNITERKRAETRAQLQTRILEQVTQGTSLQDILADFVKGLEEQRPGMLGSILLYDRAEGRLRHGAAPSLPDAYNRVVDGVEVGPEVGSCGTAAYTCEPVITEDIATDPRWEDFREVAFEHGLRACWSVPILDGEDTVLGTFAMYYRKPKQPSEADLALIDDARALARTAIDHHRDEQALREERDRYETLFESLPTPVVRCQVREEGTFIADPNGAFEEVFGLEASVAEGRDIDELLVPKERREEAVQIARRALEEGSRQAEVRRKTAEGLRDFQLQIAGRTPEEGPPEVYVIYTDITEQKKREQELVEAKKEAEKAAHLKSAMLANMSHEIRTPLTSVTGFAELLKNRLDGELEEFAEQVYRSGQRLHETLDAVLQLSRLEAGTYDLEREPVRLREVAEKTADLFQSEAAEKSVTLTTEADGPVEGRWNDAALCHIAENLLENAIKFTPAGGRVELRVRGRRDEAVLEVEDTGVGMDPEQVPELFEAFKQESEGLQREYEGTGLGLSIVKRFVEAHGGSIDVETEKGDGTCFTVRIPKANDGKETPPTSGNQERTAVAG